MPEPKKVAAPKPAKKLGVNDLNPWQLGTSEVKKDYHKATNPPLVMFA